MPVANQVDFSWLFKKLVLKKNKYLIEDISNELNIRKNHLKIDLLVTSPLSVFVPRNIFRFLKDVVHNNLYENKQKYCWKL